jgi:hypothetical protein
MFPVINPWTPGFSRVTGIRPFTAPPAAALAQVSAGQVAGALGASAVTLGVLGIGVAFTYGIARDSKTSLVKTTGYILAGVGALAAVVEAGAVGYAILKA